MNLINMQKDSIVIEIFAIFVNGYGCEVYVEKDGNRKIDFIASNGDQKNISKQLILRNQANFAKRFPVGGR